MAAKPHALDDRGPDAPARGLRVLVADEDKRALGSLDRMLRELGHEVLPFAVNVAEAARVIAALNLNLRRGSDRQGLETS